jgi:hypothetical protein
MTSMRRTVAVAVVVVMLTAGSGTTFAGRFNFTRDGSMVGDPPVSSTARVKRVLVASVRRSCVSAIREAGSTGVTRASVRLPESQSWHWSPAPA